MEKMKWNPDPNVEWTALVAFLYHIYMKNVDIQINKNQSLIQKTPASKTLKCYCFDIHTYN